MDEESNTNEESWAVEPSKKDHRRWKKALRIGLIVAALTVVAAGVGVVLLGRELRRQFKLMTYLPGPVHESVDLRSATQTAEAEEFGCPISGQEYVAVPCE